MSETTKAPNKTKKGRLNIAFLVDWLEREYQLMIMQGLIDSARRHEVNLFCIEGGPIAHQYSEFQRNYMYQLIKENNVDGLVILTASIGQNASAEQMKRFCRQFYPLPVISIGNEIEGCTSVLIDNSTGLREALAHLIQVHQYQKFAFIGGPETNIDAISRLRIFKQVLAENNLPFNADLVVDGNFGRLSGIEAVRTLLDERQATFDVIVVGNDEMALGALSELQTRGISVPDRVAVIGFDDQKSCSYSNPPLTTIDDSMYEQGITAMELLLQLIEHNPIPSKHYIPSHLVLRQSCGCLSQATIQCTSGAVAVDGRSKNTILKNQAQIIDNIVAKSRHLFLDCAGFDLPQAVSVLTLTFNGQLQGEKKEPFLKTFNQMTEKVSAQNKLHIWQDFLSILRREILPYLGADEYLRCEDLFHQVRLMISEKAVNKEKNNSFDALTRHYTINNLTELLLSSYSVSQVMKILNRYLPQLGITTGFIFEYCANQQNYRVMMAYNRHGNVPFDPKVVCAGSLMPKAIENDGKPHILLMTMLCFLKKKFSVLAVEYEEHITDFYPSLRGMISSALTGVNLVEKLHSQEKRLIAQQEHIKNLGEMRKAMDGFIQTILSMIEVRDPYTAGHQSRVSDLAGAIAIEMNLSPEVVESLRMAGAIHDLGKIVVPFEILNKPGRLKATEFALIKEHPTVAYEILKNIDFPWPIARIVAQHHERLNGSGYPAGLKDGKILQEAKILAVADVIEAMATHRPYRVALGIDMALEEIAANRGKLYDSEVVDTCLDLFYHKGYQLN
jgi:HD-GYP domain-containing protein (c-di-GMP phosphodiesterase class II)/DNA-binding LacI/PurR family transcriptional regulator